MVSPHVESYDFVHGLEMDDLGQDFLPSWRKEEGVDGLSTPKVVELSP